MKAINSHLLVQADSVRIPLPDGCVQVVCTSPPYFGLRDYGTGTWDGGDPDCRHSGGGSPQVPQTKHPNAASVIIAGGNRGGGNTCVRCGAVRVDRQLGLEESPDCGRRGAGACGRCYVCHMVVVFREVRRVLRDDGCAWVNYGDSYSGGGGFSPDAPSNQPEAAAARRAPYNQAGRRNDGGSRLYKGRQPAPGLKQKDLCGIPWRVAFALQADGWWLRSAFPWVKVNPMPESVQDRPTTAHENLFLLTKRDSYFYDSDAVRAPSAPSTLERDRYSRIVQSGNKSYVPGSPDHSGIHAPYSVVHDHETPSNPAGRNRRTSDWFLESLDERIAEQRAYLQHLESVRRKGGMLVDEGGDPLAVVLSTESFRGAHFATMPRRLVEPCLKASTSQAGCCPRCSAPLARVTEKLEGDHETAGRPKKTAGMASKTSTLSLSGNGSKEWAERGGKSLTVGWTPTCSCTETANPVPSLVLDPFCGAATTLVVAEALGLRAIGLDLSREYLTMSRRRLERPHARVAAPAAKDKPMPLLDLLGD
jgi:DNA modification methylase